MTHTVVLVLNGFDIFISVRFRSAHRGGATKEREMVGPDAIWLFRGLA